MKVELDIYSSAELDAFGDFTKKLAVSRQAEEAKQAEAYGGIAGLIAQKEASSWQTRDVTDAAPAPAATEALTPVGAATPPKATRGKKAAAAPAAEPATPPATEQAAISTGEERVDPNHPEDSAETQAADAADEAAETAVTKTALTLDDVRTKLGEYVQRFGMDAAQADGPKVIALVCGDGINKISAIPDDQAIIAKVVAGVAEMIAKNPYQRDAVAA